MDPAFGRPFMPLRESETNELHVWLATSAATAAEGLKAELSRRGSMSNPFKLWLTWCLAKLKSSIPAQVMQCLKKGVLPVQCTDPKRAHHLRGRDGWDAWRGFSVMPSSCTFHIMIAARQTSIIEGFNPFQCSLPIFCCHSFIHLPILGSSSRVSGKGG